MVFKAFILLVSINFLASAQSASEKNLTNNSSNDRYASYSPDDSKIIFESDCDRNWEIYIMDSNGENQKRITFNEDGDTLPIWSPDDKKLLFTGYRNGNFEILELTNFD